MRIGIIADTHDNIPYIRKAIQYFNEESIALVLHAGDYVAPFSVGPLEGFHGTWVGVTGTNDGDNRGLVQASKGRIHHPPFTMNYRGWRILLVHQLHPNLDLRPYDLVAHGASHKAGWQNINETLVVNPGECGGWTTGRRTVAVVEMDSRLARIVDMDNISG